MKTYRFGLARLLEWRRRLENDALMALVRAEQTEERERSRLDALCARHRAEAKRLEPDAGQRMDVEQTSRDRAWLESLSGEIRRQQQVVAHASSRCETQRQQHKKARIEREVLEKLEQRDRRKWMLANQRREQKTMDEIGAQRHVRKSREAP